jgi:putative tricarboxylic transport membrane protein
MKFHQLGAGIFWFIMGLGAAVHGYQLGLGDFHKPGPGFIFFWTALFLVVMSSIDLAGILMRGKTDKEPKPLWVGKQWHKVLLVLAILVTYVFSLNLLGFYLSSFLLMVLLLKAVQPTRWWIAIMSGILAVLISYGLFKVWLDVPFPGGILGI